MKKFLLILTLAILSNLSTAQSGWSAGNYYAYQGQAIEECGYSYPKYDYYGYFIGYYATCRLLVWESVTYSGYVNYWNYETGQWYSEWHTGTFWYCYWSGWYEKRVY